MKKISPKKYAISLYQALQEVDKEVVPKVIDSFVRLLAKHKDLSKADKIIKAFSQYANEEENILDIAVTTASPLTDEIKTAIISQLKNSLKKEIILSEFVDSDLIGGIVVRYGDIIVDGSVRKKLALLAQTLKK